MSILLDGNTLSILDVVKIARLRSKVEIDKKAIGRIKVARKVVDGIACQKEAVYGINTGFGKFADVPICENDLKTLQKNLILSHACGVGEPLPKEVVRAMLALRINALCVGNSGIDLSTVQLMIDMLNYDIVPVVPSKGSLGASGDLVPLAHMSLPLIGLGEVFFKGKRVPSEIAFEKANLKPIELGAKEGLALINGTQAMCAIATLLINDSKTLLKTADIISALTSEALTGIVAAYDERLHAARGQRGQIETAANLRKLLSSSNLSSKDRVQDAYTLRCIPQIHGASRDTLKFVEQIISNEINAVTDNPLIFPKTGEVISGGNFHGQYMAFANDFLAIAMSEIANVSERRIERLVNPQLSNCLPAFLVKKGGLNSGFMIPQYTAASLVSENKVLSHPASVDSITSSANQEDHVSMGMTAALKAKTIIENVTAVLAIELFTATQAAELRGKDKLSKSGKGIFERVRKDVPFIENDDYLAPMIEKCIALVKSGEIVKIAEKAVGKLK
ncbi:MAG: histidine ammonia-lyase [Firmicutes bacterium]|nr:histidine ammonia-lyase [Bacillota bacterium]